MKDERPATALACTARQVKPRDRFCRSGYRRVRRGGAGRNRCCYHNSTAFHLDVRRRLTRTTKSISKRRICRWRTVPFATANSNIQHNLKALEDVWDTATACTVLRHQHRRSMNATSALLPASSNVPVKVSPPEMRQPRCRARLLPVSVRLFRQPERVRLTPASRKKRSAA